MTNKEIERDPSKFIKVDYFNKDDPMNAYIQTLNLCRAFYTADGYLDLETSQRESQRAIDYEQWLETLDPEDREKELENDFVGGGAH